MTVDIITQIKIEFFETLFEIKYENAFKSLLEDKELNEIINLTYLDILNAFNSNSNKESIKEITYKYIEENTKKIKLDYIKININNSADGKILIDVSTLKKLNQEKYSDCFIFFIIGHDHYNHLFTEQIKVLNSYHLKEMELDYINSLDFYDELFW